MIVGGEEVRLDDLGERRIIRDLLAPRYEPHTVNFGDDCARLSITDGAGELILTTDPCPPPMAAALGFDDWYYRGWLLATINLSDLAAAGAEPLGLLTSLTLPGGTTVFEFQRLLDGVDECAAEQGCGVIGGNIKEAISLDISATAVGRCSGPTALGRSGAQAGDLIVVLGELGRFWAGALALRRGLIAAEPDHPLLQPALVPRPQVGIGRVARERRLLTTAIDNSDGLYPSLVQIASASKVGLDLDTSGMEFAQDVSAMAGELDIDPVRLALGWGDWQLVGTTRPETLNELREAAMERGVACSVLGRVIEGEEVLLHHKNRRGSMLCLDSERFTTGSWFTAGLDVYIATMTDADLIQTD
jgi:thiamine-monophosphate kinase